MPVQLWFEGNQNFIHGAAPFLVLFSRQSVFQRPLVSATYIQVLKHPVCGFLCKVPVPAFQKFPISSLLRGKTYIP